MTTLGGSEVIVLLLCGGIRIELKCVWYQHAATGFCLHITNSAFLWGSGTSVLSDVEVKDSSETRPGFTSFLLKFLCHSVAQLSTVRVTTQQ